MIKILDRLRGILFFWNNDVKIKRGKRSFFSFGFIFGYRVKCDVMFTDSCLYKYNNRFDQDINTLFGFTSRLFSGQRKNSARFGWNCDGDGKISLYCCVYDHGVKIVEKCVSVETFIPYGLKIHETRGTYRFIIDKKVIFIKKSKRGRFKLRRFIKPFFDGNMTAPSDMEIYMRIK